MKILATSCVLLLLFINYSSGIVSICQSATECVHNGNGSLQEFNKNQVPVTVEIFSLTNLGFLTINVTDFAGFFNLTFVSLQDNEIFIIEDFSFRDQEKLEELDLQNNRLPSSTFTINTFQGLSALHTLRLQNNLISGSLIDGVFDPLSSLEVLYLSGNQIQMIDSGTLSGLIALSELYLNDNMIQSIHNDALQDSGAIAIVDIFNNMLQYLNFTAVFYPQIGEIFTQNNNWNCTCDLKLSYDAFNMSSNSNELSCDFDHLCIQCSSPANLVGQNLLMLTTTDIPSCDASQTTTTTGSTTTASSSTATQPENNSTTTTGTTMTTDATENTTTLTSTSMTSSRGAVYNNIPLGRHLLYSLVPSVIVVLIIIIVAWIFVYNKKGKTSIRSETPPTPGNGTYHQTTDIDSDIPKNGSLTSSIFEKV